MRPRLLTLFEAFVCLLIARFSLKVAAGSHIYAPRLVPRGRQSQLEVDSDTLARIRWAVRTAARYVPCRALCFERGIAAQRMLLRRGFAVELVYGVAKKPDGTIEAHVWTRVGCETVVGGRASARFTPVAVFTADAGVVPYFSAVRQSRNTD
jgi:hypothetical protein